MGKEEKKMNMRMGMGIRFQVSNQSQISNYKNQRKSIWKRGSEMGKDELKLVINR